MKYAIALLLLAGNASAFRITGSGGSSGGISGLTANTMPKATASTTIGDSDVTDNGTTLAAFTSTFTVTKGGIVSAPSQTGLELQRTTNQNIPTAVWTPIFFSGTAWTNGNITYAASSSSTITIPATGVYTLAAHAVYSGSITPATNTNGFCVAKN